ncbi:MAG: nitroreductase/quinone reductase family protein [Actinomadura sp.]
MLPPGPRLPEARRLIDRGQYFVVRAPRQTGKTTTLLSLARELTAEGRYAALHFTCERAEAAGDDISAAELGILHSIRQATRFEELPAELLPPDPWPEAAPGSLLSEVLSVWAARCPRPLVLFFDEIDALRGASLVSVLRQLRGGFNGRPHGFPQSVVLCGLRDVRDYKAASGGDPNRLGTSSPFNVKVASFRLADFTFEQVTELYEQHTVATGQKFTPEALQRVFHASQGQPWLVNALAAEVVDELRVEPPEPITDDHMDQAVERLIVARATHLDSLVARLHEPRVKRFVQPLIAGSVPETDGTYNDDLAYLRDLGLVARTKTVQIANPIYQEVILRVLAEHTESVIDTDPRWFVTTEGRLDLPKLLEEFLSFWKLHGDVLSTRQPYHEAACQLVFMGVSSTVAAISIGSTVSAAGGSTCSSAGRTPITTASPPTSGKPSNSRSTTRDDPTRSTRAWNSSTATSTGSAWTPARSSSSTAAPNSHPYKNALASRKAAPRPGRRSPSCEPRPDLPASRAARTLCASPPCSATPSATSSRSRIQTGNKIAQTIPAFENTCDNRRLPDRGECHGGHATEAVRLAADAGDDEVHQRRPRRGLPRHRRTGREQVPRRQRVPRGVPVCLLTTRGRTTGKARTRALLYMPDGDNVVIVASRGGTPVHPHWYGNLRVHPDVLVQTRRGRRAMRARTAEGDDRADLWARLVAMYPEYGDYQTWTERTIPVVVCEPAES